MTRDIFKITYKHTEIWAISSTATDTKTQTGKFTRLQYQSICRLGEIRFSNRPHARTDSFPRCKNKH